MLFRDAKEFIGELTLTNKTISFKDVTIPLSNIAKFRDYKLTRNYRFSIIHMIIAAIVILALYDHMYWGLIFILPAAWVLYTGISERRKPDLYALYLELNSGGYHTIISQDEKGIKDLNMRIRELMNVNNDKLVTQNFHFQGGKIEFSSGDKYHVNNSQVGAIGRNASADVNFNNNN